MTQTFLHSKSFLVSQCNVVSAVRKTLIFLNNSTGFGVLPCMKTVLNKAECVDHLVRPSLVIATPS